MDQNHLTIKTYMAIMADRDAAVRERNMALEERKRAFAERDMAMLQRDAAIAERSAAICERNEAIAALHFRESSMNPNNNNNNNNLTRSSSPAIPTGDGPRYISPLQQIHHSHDTSDTSKPKKAKQPKDRENSTKRVSRSSGKGKKGVGNLGNQSSAATSDSWMSESDPDDQERAVVMWKDERGLNQVVFDESAMPVPVCSCTGAPQPCYKWGNGGWQSACCTTTMSMYPLPQMSNKRHARIGGRKMSGSAFTKLLNRLAGEGYDLYSTLDLKDHWSKHGTNRYSTLK